MGAFFLAALLVYLAPTLIAARRGRSDAGGIFIVNVVFGWTGVAWVFLLARAVSGRRKQ